MMGGKKRKKKSASQSDTASDDSSLHDGQNTSILSSLIIGAYSKSSLARCDHIYIIRAATVCLVSRMIFCSGLLR